MNEDSSRRAMVLAVPLSVALVVVSELAHVPPSGFAASVLRWLELPALSAGAIVSICAPAILAALVLAIVSRGEVDARRWPAILLALGSAFALRCVVRVALNGSLTKFSKFDAALIVACGLLWLADLVARRPLPSVFRVVRPWWLAPVPAIGAVLILSSLRLTDYPKSITRSAANLVYAYALFHAAVMLALARVRTRGSPRALGISVVVVLALLVGLFRFTSVANDARPYILARTFAGAFSLAQEKRPVDVPVPKPPPVDDARGYFLERSRMPRLPDGFSLEQHNVLLVLIDSLRFDQTSLAEPSLNTTPNLAAFASQASALTFTNAYSPSTCTAQSLAALLTLHTTGGAQWQVWKRRSQGRLLDDAITLPEMLRDDGYWNFRVNQNLYGYFTGAVIGFDEGWHHNELVSDSRWNPETDRRVADSTIVQLRAAKERGGRFFGLSFFISPHRPYLSHGKKRSRPTHLELFRDEVRYADEHVGRVLEELKASGLYDDTIVIVMADHGEEFGEHGGASHSSKVYAESSHVLLLVRIPGMERATIDATVSTAYVLPWLLLHASEAVAHAAETALAADIVPMMRATGDATLVELFDAVYTRTALVYADEKIDYDWASGLHELYAIDKDPLEQRDLFGADRLATDRAVQRIHDYRTVRAQTQNLVFDPKRLRKRKK